MATATVSGETFEPNEMPYQHLLRRVGDSLDTTAARTVRLIETVDGFEVHFVRDGRAVVEFSTYGKLMERGRRWRPAPAARKPSYQDVFRVLGYELEQLRAGVILLDEVDNGFLLTYQHLDPGGGYLLRKRLAFYASADVETLLESARTRRKRHARWLWGGG